MSSIYEPAEDSFLMSEALSKEIPKLLKQNPNLNFLEVGCGSGIGLDVAFKTGINKDRILGSDVNKKAIAYHSQSQT